MKYLPTVAVIGLGMILLAQKGSTAGPNPPPRSVPIIVQDVMQPSRMVAVSILGLPPGASTQAPISLPPGTAFILTSANLAIVDNTDFVAVKSGTSIVDKFWVQFSTQITDHHSYPAGIRFARAQNGQADLFVENLSVSGVGIADVMLHGYITDDF